MLFCPTCAVCGFPRTTLCASCASNLVPAGSMLAPAGVDRYMALVEYTCAGRSVVQSLKFHDVRPVIGAMAEPLAELVRPAVQACNPSPVVTWAPTLGSRRRHRGYDQARLLAEAVARRLDLATAALLRRRRALPQTGQGHADRIKSPSFSNRRSSPPCVLVLDDVRTSGATLAAAATALRREGAEWIIAACLAQTPLNHRVCKAEATNQ